MASFQILSKITFASQPIIRHIMVSDIISATSQNLRKGKGKVIPLQAYGAQRVLGSLRLPDSMTSALEGGRFSAIRTGRLCPQESPGTHFNRLSRPRAHGIVGYHRKNPQ
jgi:hypothetical protein